MDNKLNPLKPENVKCEKVQTSNNNYKEKSKNIKPFKVYFNLIIIMHIYLGTEDTSTFTGLIALHSPLYSYFDLDVFKAFTLTKY